MSTEGTATEEPAARAADIRDDEPDEERQSAELRMLEAVLFAAVEPLDYNSIAKRLPEGADVGGLLTDLSEIYRHRGVNLVNAGGRWAFRTAPDLHFVLQEHRQDTRRLSRAALETLAIIAYHQPVTRAEIEEIRGVGLSKGTLDLLMETGWVKIRGRRRVPGRPVTYGVTDAFLIHFGLESVQDLPGLQELKASGLLEGEVRTDFIPPSAQAGEDPLDDEEAAGAD